MTIGTPRIQKATFKKCQDKSPYFWNCATTYVCKLLWLCIHNPVYWNASYLIYHGILGLHISLFHYYFAWDQHLAHDPPIVQLTPEKCWLDCLCKSFVLAARECEVQVQLTFWSISVVNQNVIMLSWELMSPDNRTWAKLATVVHFKKWNSVTNVVFFEAWNATDFLAAVLHVVPVW